MHYYGIRGKTLRFFKNLYKGSTFGVQTGQGTLSILYALLRGLRHGCPASPTLFNLFINDIFWSKLGSPMGVNVPVERGSPWDPAEIKIAGLLFADDLVGFCGDLGQVRRMCAHLGAWAEANGMKFGIRKCGIMATSDLGHTLLSQEAELDPFLLNGEVVPIVSKYKYLGLWVTRDLDLAYMASQRLELGRKSLLSLRAFLGYQRLPMHLKVVVIIAILIPQLM